MQIQEYDLHIQHITRAANFLADTMSRDPAVLSESEIRELSNPREIMIAAIYLSIESPSVV